MVCWTGIGCPVLSRCAAICTKHPTLPATTASAPDRDHGASFRGAERLGDFRLFQVVEPGRSAADVTVSDLAHGEVADRAEQAARRGAHVLRV